MLYPNRIQTALLFDTRVDHLEAVMRDFLRIEGIRSNAHFHLSEQNPGRFYRLFEGTEELMVTLEYVDGPCDERHFAGPLASPYTGIVTPDIRSRIGRTYGHVLLEVSHGVMGGVEEDPKIAAMLEAIGRPRSGASQPQFERRLAVLTLLTRIAIDHGMPLAVHWTQSGLLLGGEVFEHIAASDSVPGPLHIHPQMFGPRAASGDTPLVGIRTFGARHWLGREIIVEPNVLPWTANFETILAFMRIATAENGYVIPDGDTFGPEDRSLSYRVLHHETGAMIGQTDPSPADMPLYELVPLKHLAHGFVSPEHVPDDRVIDDRAFPLDLMPADQDEKMALANEWFEKRKLAEGIGGRFEVRHPDLPAAAPPPPSAPPPPPAEPGLTGVSGRGVRARVFGRKGL
jgi:hypothetical protein